MQRYANNITTQTGNAVAGAVVRVLNYPALTLATIFSTNDGAAQVNPIVADKFGFFAFYAPDGRYSLQITGNGIATYQLDDVLLEDSLAFDATNVKNSGAKGDGSTDDTAAILAAGAAGSGDIYFPAGNYVCQPSVLQYNPRFVGPGILNIGTDTLPAGRFAPSSFQISIPSTYPDINSALGFLQNRVLGNGVIVTLQIADGTYTFQQVFPFHPQGGQIQIIGNQAVRANVVLQFDTSNSQCAFNCTEGYGLRLVDGMTIVGLNGWQSHGVWNAAIKPYGCGAVARRGSRIRFGANVIIQKFYYGLRAEHGGSIIADPGCWVQESGDVGIHSIGGSVECSGAYSNNASDVAFGIGYGFLAELAGSMLAQGAHSWGNAYAGAAAISAGSMWAWNFDCHDNPNYGLYAANGGDMDAYSNPPDNQQTGVFNNKIGVFCEQGGHIEFGGSKSYNNSSHGIKANGGTINADGATSTGNGGVGQAAVQNGLIYGAVTSTSNGVADFAQTGGILGATHG